MVWIAVAIVGAQFVGRLYTLCAKEQDMSGRTSDLILVILCALGLYGIWQR